MKFYLGILVGAVAIFMWGFVVWVILAMNFGILKGIPNEEKVVPVLADAKLPTGVYIYPSGVPGKDLTGEAKIADQKTLDEQCRNGPFLRIFVNTQGRPHEDMDKLVTGFLHILLASALMATLTRCVLSWADFKARYAFVVAIGVFAAIWVDLSPAIWMAAPWDYQLYTAGYDIGAWILAGIPIAWGTRGRPVVG